MADGFVVVQAIPPEGGTVTTATAIVPWTERLEPRRNFTPLEEGDQARVMGGKYKHLIVTVLGICERGAVVRIGGKLAYYFYPWLEYVDPAEKNYEWPPA